MHLKIGPVVVRFQSPVDVYRRAPKQWLCVNQNCPRVWDQPRRLTVDGRCPSCGGGLKRGGALAGLAHRSF